MLQTKHTRCNFHKNCFSSYCMYDRSKEQNSPYVKKKQKKKTKKNKKLSFKSSPYVFFFFFFFFFFFCFVFCKCFKYFFPGRHILVCKRCPSSKMIVLCKLLRAQELYQCACAKVTGYTILTSSFASVYKSSFPALVLD